MMLPIGPLMIDIESTQLSDEDRELLRHPLVGGLIFFRRNYEDPAQIKELIQQVRKTNPMLLIAVDQEGGRVQRFLTGLTSLPAAKEIGARYDSDPEQALLMAFQTGNTMARELRDLDVDFSFAPVVDLDYGNSEVIGSRSFHHQPAAVCQLSTSFIQGMREAGMAAVAKHYPGHGYVSADSHTDITIDDRSWEAIEARDLMPFIHLIQQGIEGIMAAHVIYPKVCEAPAGYSGIWLKKLLRNTYGFKGVVFSDCLSMAGANTLVPMTARVQTALLAGCDMVLICNNRASVYEVIQSLAFTNHPDSWQRLQAMRGVTSKQIQS